MFGEQSSTYVRPLRPGEAVESGKWSKEFVRTSNNKFEGRSKQEIVMSNKERRFTYDGIWLRYQSVLAKFRLSSAVSHFSGDITQIVANQHFIYKISNMRTLIVYIDRHTHSLEIT